MDLYLVFRDFSRRSIGTGFLADQRRGLNSLNSASECFKSNQSLRDILQTMSNAEIKQYKIFVDDFLVGTVYNFQNVKANLLFC